MSDSKVGFRDPSKHVEIIIIAYQVDSDLKLLYGYVFCISALKCLVHVLILSSSF